MSNLMVVRIKEQAEEMGHKPVNIFTGEEVADQLKENDSQTADHRTGGGTNDSSQYKN